jgi:hypothetical protein
MDRFAYSFQGRTYVLVAMSVSLRRPEQRRARQPLHVIDRFVRAYRTATVSSYQLDHVKVFPF